MNLSPGRFQTLLAVCELLGTREQLTIENLKDLIRFQPTQSSIDLIDDAVQIAVSSGLLRDKAGLLSVTASIQNLISNPDRLFVARKLLFRVVRKHFPELIAFSYAEIRKIRHEIDGNLRAVLDDCRLLEVEQDDGAIEWWDSLRSLGRFELDESKKEVGNEAEKRSYLHEKARLRSSGIPRIDESISWVANENDYAGFDILSINLGSDHEYPPSSSLQIEVKTGRMENSGGFSFMLTRNEYQVLHSRAMAWVMHVWLFEVGTNNFRAEPFKISRSQVESRVPETSPDFQWETARIKFLNT